MQTTGPELAMEMPNVTSSKFFSPAFNAAIFDGPLRIYFAQYQEPEALKLYFKFQDHFNFDQKRFQGSLRDNKNSHVFVMLYPTSDIFSRSFEESDTHRIASGKLGQDVVVGVNGVVDEMDYDMIFDEVKDVFAPISN